MEELILNGEYTYTDLMSIAEGKWWMLSHSENESDILGETFLVFKPLDDPNIEDPANVCDGAVLSFIMSGYNTQGIFRLIYKYV